MNKFDSFEDLNGKVSAFWFGQNVIFRRNSFEQFSSRQIFGQNDRLQIALVIVKKANDVFLKKQVLLHCCALSVNMPKLQDGEGIKALRLRHFGKLNYRRNAWAAMHKGQCTRGNVICRVLGLVDCGSAAKGDYAPQIERFYTIPYRLIDWLNHL